MSHNVPRVCGLVMHEYVKIAVKNEEENMWNFDKCLCIHEDITLCTDFAHSL